jgi:hypothetical protein
MLECLRARLPAPQTTRGHRTNNLAAIHDRIALCEGSARYCRILDTKKDRGYADLFMAAATGKRTLL